MIKDFTVEIDGKSVSLLDAPLKAPEPGHDRDDPDRCEWVVGVDWVQTLDRDEAIWEQEMFANQNTACRLRSQFTIDRLVERFGPRR